MKNASDEFTRDKTKRSIVGLFNKFKEEGKQAVSVAHVLSFIICV